MKYLITEEIESPNRVWKNVDAVDFFFVVGYVSVAFALRSLVHPALHIPYLVFSLFFAVFLTCRSMWNRKRRNYESFFLMIKHDTSVYRAIYGEEGIANDEEKEE